MGPVGGHEVLRLDRPDGQDLVVGPSIPHHAHALHRQKDGESLRHLPHQPGPVELLQHDRVGLAERVEAGAGDVTQATDGESRAGERVPPDELLREPQLQAEPAGLVFEQIPQWFDELELEVFREPADVVVEFDRGGRPVRGGATLDDVRVERSLGEVLRSLDPRPLDSRGLVGEAFHEGLADPPPLFLRLGHPGEDTEKLLLRRDDVEVGLEVGGELLDDGGGLVLPQEAVVDEDARHLIADGPAEKRGDDR